MPKVEKKTLAELIAALDSSTLTLADILHDLEWAARERKRCKVKDEKYKQKAKEAKEAADAAKALQDATVPE